MHTRFVPTVFTSAERFGCRQDSNLRLPVPNQAINLPFLDAPQENELASARQRHLGSSSLNAKPRSESVGKNVLVVWPFELRRVVHRSDFNRTCQLRSTVDTSVGQIRDSWDLVVRRRCVLSWLRMTDSNMDGCCPSQSTLAANLVRGRRNESVGKNILVANWCVKRRELNVSFWGILWRSLSDPDALQPLKNTGKSMI